MVKPTREKVLELLTWMRAHQPHVYRGFVNRFVPPGAGIAGIWDTLTSLPGKALTAVSNFASSQGFDKLLDAAQPFIANKLQEKELKLQIQRINAGLPVTEPGAAAAGAPPPPSEPARRDPWPWVIGAAGVAGLIALLSMRR